MKTLLIWEEIPESTKLYLLDGELAELALKAHNQFVNGGDDDDYADRLSVSLEGLEPLDDSQPIAINDINEPVNVVISGFIM